MMPRVLALTIVMLMGAGPAEARQVASPHDRVGDTYEIRVRSTTESASDDGSSSSSRSGGLLTERVVAVHDASVELEFDLPPDATAEERARDWQWPARVLKSPDGSLRLLNAPELEARIDAWLTLGGMTREACGHWIFTWNAFKIECDPQSVIGSLEAFDLRPAALAEGASYAQPGALGPTVLRRESTGREGEVFVAETPLDPELVRRERAESDVVVAELMGAPKTMEAALEARAGEHFAGTITTTLETDVEGRVMRRTTVTHLITTDAESVAEHTTSTHSVERWPLQPGG